MEYSMFLYFEPSYIRINKYIIFVKILVKEFICISSIGFTQEHDKITI